MDTARYMLAALANACAAHGTDFETLAELRDLCADEGRPAAVELIDIAIKYGMDVRGGEAYGVHAPAYIDGVGPVFVACALADAAGGVRLEVSYRIAGVYGNALKAALTEWSARHDEEAPYSITESGEVRTAGWRACQDDQRPDANPYPRGTRRYDSWLSGWADAEDAARTEENMTDIEEYEW